MFVYSHSRAGSPGKLAHDFKVDFAKSRGMDPNDPRIKRLSDIQFVDSPDAIAKGDRVKQNDLELEYNALEKLIDREVRSKKFVF